MFTPPPSPAKPHHQIPSFPQMSPTLEKDMAEHSGHPPPLPTTHDLKKRTGRRTRLAVVVIPLALILITLSTRWITHPAMFDLLARPPAPDRWQHVFDTMSEGKLHKRHPGVQVDAAVGSPSLTLAQSETAFPSKAPSATTGNPASGTGTPTLTLPTIPASPPILPTPFPQSFDSSLQANFSNTACYNFFLNMTNTQPFRSCRPFSLLLQSSGQFINLQTNVSTANAVQWGTCNTSINEDQCVKNMAWFASNLQTTCSADLTQHNTLAVNALQGLQAYALMRKTGCLTDQTTNTYCYIEAANNSNPSDIYYYQLPLGISVPSKAVPSCSACTKGMLALYAAALGNSSQANSLGDGLKTTYTAAAALSEARCGPGYSPSVRTSAGVQTSRPTVRIIVGIVVAIGISLMLVS